jgi:hypothetical protein
VMRATPPTRAPVKGVTERSTGAAHFHLSAIGATQSHESVVRSTPRYFTVAVPTSGLQGTEPVPFHPRKPCVD